MIYREIHEADIPAILEVRTATRENRLSMQELEDRGITPESVAEGLRSHDKGWLCEDGGKIVGFIIGNGDSGEILVIALLPEAENKGIGRELMKRTQEWLFSKGHQELWLMENPDPAIRAYRFYRKLGWVATGEFRHGEQVLKLQKDECIKRGLLRV